MIIKCLAPLGGMGRRQYWGVPLALVGVLCSLFSARAATAAPTVKAFPTAEGFGANAVGGRGGRIIEVTNLNDSGEGSLRSAMEASGPRICVFRVSGTITLKSAIRVSTPYLTVAGQTSPGGVQIKGTGQPDGDWGVWCVSGAHDIILRHLRVRMGGNMKHDAGNNILFYGTAEPGVHDVIVDHCSVSWGSDTQLDWYGSYLERVTFQWNIIAECYMGQHIGGNRAPKNVTLHHNLYANLGSRTPLMQRADVFDFRNNVIYNWNGNNASVFGQFALNSSAFGNVVNNLWLAGPESGYPYLNVGNGGPMRIDGSPAEAGGTKLYLSGNWGPRCPTGCDNDWAGHGVNTWDYYELNRDGSTHRVDEAQYSAGKPFPAPVVNLDPVGDLLDKILPTVGACKPSRDAIDQRIVRSVRDKTGTSRVRTTGPWPDLASDAPSPPADSDHDGMPDAWEKAHGLDPNNARDGAVVAANGYTNVENYLNELAGDMIPDLNVPPVRKVPMWGRFETSIVNSRDYANPFMDVALAATFTRPDASRVAFRGFYDGDGHGGQTGNVWKLRFMPDQVGTWSYECSFSDSTPGRSGTFECVSDGAQPGPLRVDPNNPHGWRLADGSHFFARAYTAPELFVAGNHTHRTYWIDYFFGAKHRFNLCNANLLNFVGIGEELNWQRTAYKAPDPAQVGKYVTIAGNGLFPFLYTGARPRFDGGSNVDWLRPSLRCWANVDQILGELEARKVVWFNHWGMLGWDWSGNGRLLVPPAARQAVLQYWIARLAPWWNVTWNIAGEWDELMTPAEFDELGTLLKEMDPWKHPLTSHALGTTLDRPWVDFRVQQFAAGTSSEAVANAGRAMADYSNKPVFAFETSWEATPGKLTPDQVRTGAWGSVMGGAFYLYAECFEPSLTWGDGGAFAFIEIMNDFLGGLPYWKLKPDNTLVNSRSLCLADPGREYVVYRQSGGIMTIDLPGGVGPAFEAEWLDPRTGRTSPAGDVNGGVKHTFSCPDARDWVLRLRRG